MNVLSQIYGNIKHCDIQNNGGSALAAKTGKPGKMLKGECRFCGKKELLLILNIIHKLLFIGW